LKNTLTGNPIHSKIPLSPDNSKPTPATQYTMKTQAEITTIKSIIATATRNAGITDTRDGWEFNFKNYIADTLGEAVESMLNDTEDADEIRLLNDLIDTLEQETETPTA
jgi:hypothetical protein